MEKLPDDTIISGFEYEYDEIGRISSEKALAKNEKMCYTYDEQSRVVKRTVICLSGSTETEETFSYDAAGNVTADNSHAFVYDVNNRLTEYDGNAVTYDEDGNMLSATLNGEETAFSFDSGNRLTSVGGHVYTYNAENVRIRNLCADADTTYVYNTNCKLSQLLCKTTNGIITKYVYGLGLIGEEKCGEFETYHFDYRGSTVAITDIAGNITDTFAYDTYGKLISRTGSSFVIFGYNGRDGVVTDKNGLIYMRARYYSPELRRFINADVVAGSLDNAITLNRFAYANGNPVSLIDPFGLSAERGSSWSEETCKILKKGWNAAKEIGSILIQNYSDMIQAFRSGNFTSWAVERFKELTAEGKLDASIDFILNAIPDENGIYHIGQGYWQSFEFVGYNHFYDKVFDIATRCTGTSSKAMPFFFELDDGTQYVIWAWKGDYINLGSGAELGIYKQGIPELHWLTSPEDAMPMTLSLRQIDTNETLYHYAPAEKNWWIMGFNPSHQNAQANNLEATYTIDFTGKEELYNAFKNTWEGEGYWTFRGMTATWVWNG